jgi:hypothetical protein
MSDIITRLRAFVACEGGDIADIEEAANTIEALRTPLTEGEISKALASQRFPPKGWPQDMIDFAHGIQAALEARSKKA